MRYVNDTTLYPYKEDFVLGSLENVENENMDGQNKLSKLNKIVVNVTATRHNIFRKI